MPIYEYKCKKCSNIFEAFQSIGADGEKLECPKCGAPKPEKLFSAFASSDGSSFGSGGSSSGGCAPRSGFS